MKFVKKKKVSSYFLTDFTNLETAPLDYNFFRKHFFYKQYLRLKAYLSLVKIVAPLDNNKICFPKQILGGKHNSGRICPCKRS